MTTSDFRKRTGKLDGIDNLTPNEQAWLEFLRLITCDAVPPITLSAVQALRLAVLAANTPKGVG